MKKNVKLQAYIQRKNDLAFNFVPVEECSGDLQLVAWLRSRDRSQSESELE